MLRLLRLKMCLVREDFFLLKSSCPGLSIICLFSVNLISWFLIAERHLSLFL